MLDMEDTNRTLNVCVASAIEFTGVHHVGFLCENVEKSLDFYCGLLGTFLSCSSYLWVSLCTCFSPSTICQNLLEFLSLEHF